MEGEMAGQTENTPATVPLAQQAGAAMRLWTHAKPCVWTPRMLAALISGVEGGKWFRLFDKVFAERNLFAASQQVISKKGAAGVDHVTTEEFLRQTPENLWQLSDALKNGTYRPQAIRRVHIPKPGSTETRPLGIPTVRDRLVQAAIVNVIEPIFERDFAEHSYGFRPGRGCKDALRRVDHLLKAGNVYVIDADLKGYFDSIPHAKLMDRLRTKLADGSLLSLIQEFLQAGIQDGTAEWTPESGAPQGAVLSPLLSNIYLDPLDHLMAESGFEMVRYADDFVILCRTAEQAAKALEIVQRWTTDNGLTLHPTKTRIVDSQQQSFAFLGYEFRKIKHWPRKKSIQKLKDSVRMKTRRTNGDSLKCIVTNLNHTLYGWFGYFQHSSHKGVFEQLDQWIRTRLRNILSRRMGHAGRGRGFDKIRWPNIYFRQQGLFSLSAALAAARQSSRR